MNPILAPVNLKIYPNPGGKAKVRKQHLRKVNNSKKLKWMLVSLPQEVQVAEEQVGEVVPDYKGI
jgi:hypothetical protein